MSNFLLNKGKWAIYRTGPRGGKIKMFKVPTRKEARAESNYWTKFMGEKISYSKV